MTTSRACCRTSSRGGPPRSTCSTAAYPPRGAGQGYPLPGTIAWLPWSRASNGPGRRSREGCPRPRGVSSIRDVEGVYNRGSFPYSYRNESNFHDVRVHRRGRVLGEHRGRAMTAPTARPPLLDVTGLRVTYGGVVAVADVDLQVAEGSVYGLIGPNGAGKTSVVDALTGYTKPAAGRITFAGGDIGGPRAYLGVVRW